jgi:hypothetical protein
MELTESQTRSLFIMVSFLALATIAQGRNRMNTSATISNTSSAPMESVNDKLADGNEHAKSACSGNTT